MDVCTLASTALIYQRTPGKGTATAYASCACMGGIPTLEHAPDLRSWPALSETASPLEAGDGMTAISPSTVMTHAGGFQPRSTRHARQLRPRGWGGTGRWDLLQLEPMALDGGINFGPALGSVVERRSRKDQRLLFRGTKSSPWCCSGADRCGGRSGPTVRSVAALRLLPR